MLLLLLAAATLPSPPPLYTSETGWRVARQRYETPEFDQAVAAHKRGDIVGASAILRRLADQGNPLAQVNLGNFCARGIAGKPDYSCAFKLYDQAARAGFDEGQYRLARLLDAGLGTTRDPAAAFHWYKLAAEQGVLPEAETELGLSYSTGSGVQRDDAEALSWLKKAAARQFANAQYHLGKIYREGRGVKQNYDEAVYYLTAAANQGHKRAVRELGFLYSSGILGTADDKKALKWFELVDRT